MHRRAVYERWSLWFFLPSVPDVLVKSIAYGVPLGKDTLDVWWFLSVHYSVPDLGIMSDQSDGRVMDTREAMLGSAFKMSERQQGIKMTESTT